VQGIPVIPVNKAEDTKILIGKNGRPSRRTGTRGCWPHKTTAGFSFLQAVFERLVDIICDKMSESLDSDPSMLNSNKGTRLGEAQVCAEIS
jgi:hypothetical protein